MPEQLQEVRETLLGLDPQVLIGAAVGVVIIFVVIKIFSLSFWLLKNSLIGVIVLYAINFIGFVTIKITFIHCVIVGIFGVPGLVGLWIYLNYLK
ncbi:MAG: pro-sigmaK processing inhibitor BofA family protein [Selenomonadaceae bacterium]|nr:pro-sigmaK processing inhibitor BofA family protein [Selenomonadaceae bacterium]